MPLANTKIVWRNPTLEGKFLYLQWPDLLQNSGRTVFVFAGITSTQRFTRATTPHFQYSPFICLLINICLWWKYRIQIYPNLVWHNFQSLCSRIAFGTYFDLSPSTFFTLIFYWGERYEKEMLTDEFFYVSSTWQIFPLFVNCSLQIATSLQSYYF